MLLIHRVTFENRCYKEIKGLMRTVLWGVAPCTPFEARRRFGGTSFIQFQSRRVRQPARKLRAVLIIVYILWTCETSVSMDGMIILKLITGCEDVYWGDVSGQGLPNISRGCTRGRVYTGLPHDSQLG
jgi:hypothetical protein